MNTLNTLNTSATLETLVKILDNKASVSHLAYLQRRFFGLTLNLDANDWRTIRNEHYWNMTDHLLRKGDWRSTEEALNYKIQLIEIYKANQLYAKNNQHQQP